jgi:hypothetical protein
MNCHFFASLFVRSGVTYKRGALTVVFSSSEGSNKIIVRSEMEKIMKKTFSFYGLGLGCYLIPKCHTIKHP